MALPFDTDQLVTHIRDLVAVQGSQKAAALAWGISPAYLNDVLQGRREPAGKLLQALGFVREVRYVLIDALVIE